ncbi:MAG: hypothetical protein EPN36_08295 [Rhodanobacteraceae bacterium]|nr:MAG: hypothetical protein EPN36_08295 [Rhodanobacteraceae bacterium]
MGWLKTIATELWGLFVEDGRYALTIVVWLALVWLALPRLDLGRGWNAVILAIGLLLILLEGTLRGARRGRG